jgi:hypothetical protein
MKHYPRVQIGLRKFPLQTLHTALIIVVPNSPSPSFFSDRDASRWNLDPQQVQKRRKLFWELMYQDGVHVRVLAGPLTTPLLISFAFFASPR